VSIVAFGFRHTRVRGVAIPGHIAFPEINLRFYVRRHGERAVVFIREYVPRPAISLVAKLFYNEPYRTTRMEHVVTAGRDALHVRHRFGPRKSSRLEAIASLDGRLPDPGSPEHWLTHHDLGVGRTRPQLPRRARAVGAARHPHAEHGRRLRPALRRAVGVPRQRDAVARHAGDRLRGPRARTGRRVIAAPARPATQASTRGLLAG
jgi:hypothetical protein